VKQFVSHGVAKPLCTGHAHGIDLDDRSTEHVPTTTVFASSACIERTHANVGISLVDHESIAGAVETWPQLEQRLPLPREPSGHVNAIFDRNANGACRDGCSRSNGSRARCE
jgi:hypothetical protein